MRELIALIFAMLFTAALVSCASEPTPFKTGKEVSAPKGYTDCIARGDKC